MCLAIPGKVIEKNNDTAIVNFNGIEKKVNIALVNCNIGDYLLVHVGFAIEKIDEIEAKKTYKLLSELND